MWSLDRLELVDRFLALPPGAEQRAQRMAMRGVVVSQALQDDPPETWQTFERLRSLGLERDEAVSQLTMVVTDHLLSALRSNASFDRSAYVAGLAELPLPSADTVAQALVDVARAEPGIGADEHTDRALAIVSPSGSPLAASMIDTMLDRLVNGPLHWLPGDLTVHVPDLVDASYVHPSLQRGGGGPRRTDRRARSRRVRALRHHPVAGRHRARPVLRRACAPRVAWPGRLARRVHSGRPARRDGCGVGPRRWRGRADRGDGDDRAARRRAGRFVTTPCTPCVTPTTSSSPNPGSP